MNYFWRAGHISTNGQNLQFLLPSPGFGVKSESILSVPSSLNTVSTKCIKSLTARFTDGPPLAGTNLEIRGMVNSVFSLIFRLMIWNSTCIFSIG